jgi:hypothetical protein
MKALFVSIVMATTLVPAAGCVSEDPAPVYYEGTDEGGADLVEVSPGVEVIADWDEPIFFVNNYYWVNRGGAWYWSTWYGGGWAVNRRPPQTIVSIGNPTQYAHYKPAGWVAHEHVTGGEKVHAQYHNDHPASGYKVRAASHGGKR